MEGHFGWQKQWIVHAIHARNDVVLPLPLFLSLGLNNHTSVTLPACLLALGYWTGFSWIIWSGDWETSHSKYRWQFNTRQNSNDSLLIPYCAGKALLQCLRLATKMGELGVLSLLMHSLGRGWSRGWGPCGRAQKHVILPEGMLILFASVRIYCWSWVTTISANSLSRFT